MKWRGSAFCRHQHDIQTERSEQFHFSASTAACQHAAGQPTLLSRCPVVPVPSLLLHSRAVQLTLLALLLHLSLVTSCNVTA